MACVGIAGIPNDAESLAEARWLMNDRERFRNLMRGEPVDRPPFLEEGVRDEVLDSWRKQGMPAGKTHVDVFGLTPHENLGPDLRYAAGYFGRVFDLSPREYRKAFDISPRRFPRDWKRTVRRLEKRDTCVSHHNRR